MAITVNDLELPKNIKDALLFRHGNKDVKKFVTGGKWWEDIKGVGPAWGEIIEEQINRKKEYFCIAQCTNTVCLYRGQSFSPNSAYKDCPSPDMKIRLERLDLPYHISRQLLKTNLDKLEGNWWENIFGIGPHWGRIINAKIAHARKKVYSEEEENCRTCIRFSCTQKESKRQGCSEKVYREYKTKRCRNCQHKDNAATCGFRPYDDNMCMGFKEMSCRTCGISDCSTEKREPGVCKDWVKQIVVNYRVDVMPEIPDLSESIANEIKEAVGEKKPMSINEYIETLQEIKRLVAKVGLTGRVTLHENQ